jgi:hypothetical protein
MSNGVRIDVESEDIAIETQQLEWKDKARTLNAGTNEAVNVYQSNGTGFSGVGFHADARKRTWEFSGGVSGTYIHDDDEEEPENAEDEAAVEDAENTAADAVSAEYPAKLPAEGGVVESAPMSQ